LRFNQARLLNQKIGKLGMAGLFIKVGSEQERRKHALSELDLLNGPRGSVLPSAGYWLPGLTRHKTIRRNGRDRRLFGPMLRR
jgi:hypothetical protein